MIVIENMVIGLPKIVPSDGAGTKCMLGKHHHAYFDFEKAWRAHEQLELIQNYLCCMNKPSLVGANKILTLIDDINTFIWVYFLKNKIHVFERFKKFRALAEKQYGPPIKSLRSDNGGEFMSL